MEEETREARGRMQKELDALQALSKSLSNENKSLRQQKLALNERCEELLKKVISIILSRIYSPFSFVKVDSSISTYSYFRYWHSKKHFDL